MRKALTIACAVMVGVLAVFLVVQLWNDAHRGPITGCHVVGKGDCPQHTLWMHQKVGTVYMTVPVVIHARWWIDVAGNDRAGVCVTRSVDVAEDVWAMAKLGDSWADLP